MGKFSQKYLILLVGTCGSENVISPDSDQRTLHKIRPAGNGIIRPKFEASRFTLLPISSAFRP